MGLETFEKIVVRVEMERCKSVREEQLVLCVWCGSSQGKLNKGDI